MTPDGAVVNRRRSRPATLQGDYITCPEGVRPEDPRIERDGERYKVQRGKVAKTVSFFSVDPDVWVPPLRIPPAPAAVGGK